MARRNYRNQFRAQDAVAPTVDTSGIVDYAGWMHEMNRYKQQVMGQRENEFLEFVNVDLINSLAERDTEQQVNDIEAFQEKWKPVYQERKGKLTAEDKMSILADKKKIIQGQNKILTVQEDRNNAIKIAMANPDKFDATATRQLWEQYKNTGKIPDKWLVPTAMDLREWGYENSQAKKKISVDKNLVTNADGSVTQVTQIPEEINDEAAWLDDFTYLYKTDKTGRVQLALDEAWERGSDEDKNRWINMAKKSGASEDQLEDNAKFFAGFEEAYGQKIGKSERDVPTGRPKPGQDVEGREVLSGDVSIPNFAYEGYTEIGDEGSTAYKDAKITNITMKEGIPYVKITIPKVPSIEDTRDYIVKASGLSEERYQEMKVNYDTYNNLSDEAKKDVNKSKKDKDKKLKSDWEEYEVFEQAIKVRNEKDRKTPSRTELEVRERPMTMTDAVALESKYNVNFYKDAILNKSYRGFPVKTLDAFLSVLNSQSPREDGAQWTVDNLWDEFSYEDVSSAIEEIKKQKRNAK